jgi:hypothetical protein
VAHLKRTAPSPVGYSGTPLPQKLGIKPGRVVLLVAAPDGFEQRLGALPEGASLRRRAAIAHLTIWFVASRAVLARQVKARAAALGQDGIWICWPKKASGVPTDVTEQAVRETGLLHGLVDYKVCAIDATWSGLKFARRK